MAIARGDVPAAMRGTLEGVAQAALAAGLPALVWIMAPFVERRFRALGVCATRVGKARLRRETRDQLAYLLTYHDYFLPALGGRGLDVDPAGLARGGNPDALRALVSDCPDGTDLYCMRSDAFAAGLRQSSTPASGEGEAG